MRARVRCLAYPRSGLPNRNGLWCVYIYFKTIYDFILFFEHIVMVPVPSYFSLSSATLPKPAVSPYFLSFITYIISSLLTHLQTTLSIPPPHYPVPYSPHFSIQQLNKILFPSAFNFFFPIHLLSPRISQSYTS